MAMETIRINTPAVDEGVRGMSKMASMFSTIPHKVARTFGAVAYTIESYIGPMNLEVLSPRHRYKLSTHDKANIDARLNGNGFGTF
jgi:hypothetical protein